MANQFYSKDHYRRVSPPADNQADIDWRWKRNRMLEVARAEQGDKFPIITPANFQEACDFFERRFKELMS